MTVQVNDLLTYRQKRLNLIKQPLLQWIPVCRISTHIHTHIIRNLRKEIFFSRLQCFYTHTHTHITKSLSRYLYLLH